MPKAPAKSEEKPAARKADAGPELKRPKGDKPTVYLIDTFAFIFRAYHAMMRQRSMTTRSGIPTAAIYVFVNMLNKLRQDFGPEYLAAVYDVSGPTFRDVEAEKVTTIKKFDVKTQKFEEVEYRGYKANRAAMPEELAQQLPYIERALEAYRIPILKSEGYEADDVIGTLAKQAAAKGHPVYVLSSDKDMMQLVNDRVFILNLAKDNLILDPDGVQQALGVPPEKVVDVMALRGDAIDNIPGAPGIGEKGSLELVQRFGTVESALDRAAEIEHKSYRESLEHNRELVMFSKRMATIETNVPVKLELEAMASQEPDYDALRKLFNELEFTSLLKTVVPDAGAEVSATEYGELKTEKELSALLAKAKKSTLAVAFAALKEQTGTEDADEEALTESKPAVSGDLFAAVAPEKTEIEVGLSAEAGVGAHAKLAGPVGKKIEAALADEKVAKSVHDLKSALHACREAHVSLAGVKHDTFLYSYLLDPTDSRHPLPIVALRRFNVQLSGSLAQAADYTARLAPALRPEIEREGLLPVYEDIELPLAPVLARMEEAGVSLDTEVLAGLSTRLGKECDDKARKIHKLAGEEFNINSPKQLSRILFEVLKLEPPARRGGRVKATSTAQDVLEELALHHDLPRLVLEYRTVAKLKSTYVDALPALVDARTGRLHTTFNQAGTATGRLSSTNPNLQNIPIRTEQGREIRAAFLAAPGHALLAADYSQIELRLLAHYSEDPLLLEAFRRGDDIHTLTAGEVFGVPTVLVTPEHRRQAKAVNFGIVYGLSAFGLAQQLGIEQKEAKRYIEHYFETYKGVRAFIDRTLEETRRAGNVRTLFGRKRPIPDINNSNPNLRGFAERTAVNTPLQGTAADLIKLAMIRIDAELRARRLKTRMTLQVHDELVFEAPKGEVEELRALVTELMENVHALKVPLEVEVGVGKNWRDMD
ncbi:MAG: DNA polymerase I [Acidobacteriales bacterium]|nr:DNA polymerase I [Terriglobales bacterium]